MWIRRNPFQKLGGIDQVFAPFQCDDADACMRAWMNGWRVGLYSAAFKRLALRGMELFNAEKISDQAARNWAIVYERYGTSIKDGTLARKISNLNSS
jgi:hypothetical protein